jgi:hypothetical protein
MISLKKLFVASLCALALTGVGCNLSAHAPDQSSAESAVNGFLMGIQKQDKAAAEAYIQPGSDLEKDFDEDAWADIEKNPLQSFTIGKKEDNTVSAQVKVKTSDGVKDTNIMVDVVEQDGKWWVVNL